MPACRVAGVKCRHSAFQHLAEAQDSLLGARLTPIGARWLRARQSFSLRISLTEVRRLWRKAVLESAINPAYQWSLQQLLATMDISAHPI